MCVAKRHADLDCSGHIHRPGTGELQGQEQAGGAAHSYPETPSELTRSRCHPMSSQSQSRRTIT